MENLKHKSLALVALIALAGILFTGCGEKIGDSPKSTLQGFYKSVCDADKESFEKSLSADSLQNIEMYGTLSGGDLFEVLTRKAKETGCNDSLEIIEEQIDGKKAVVVFTETEGGKKQRAKLINTNDGWKMDLSNMKK